MSHPVNPPLPARRLLRTPEDLIAAGLVPPEQREALAAVAQDYATAIPPAFLDLIEQPDDPIGIQVIPSPEELLVTPEERSDPIGMMRSPQCRALCIDTRTALCSSPCWSARFIAAFVSGESMWGRMAVCWMMPRWRWRWTGCGRIPQSGK